LREALSEIPEIMFRTVPDGGVENYSFLNIFLPNLEITRLVSKAFKEEGVDGCFHYYDNHWHYIRKWEHLKELKTLYPVSLDVSKGLEYLKNKSFEQSDYFIGRNLSCLIKLSWTEAEVIDRAHKMAQIIKRML